MERPIVPSSRSLRQRALRAWTYCGDPSGWSASERRRRHCRGAPCGLPREGASPSPTFRRAATSSRLRAGSLAPFDDPCAALDEPPHSRTTRTNLGQPMKGVGGDSLTGIHLGLHAHPGSRSGKGSPSSEGHGRVKPKTREIPCPIPISGLSPDVQQADELRVVAGARRELSGYVPEVSPGAGLQGVLAAEGRIAPWDSAPGLTSQDRSQLPRPPWSPVPNSLKAPKNGQG